MDTRFKRTVKKTANQPLSAYDKENRSVKIWDKGTYTLTGGKTKGEIEKAFLQGLSNNKLSFVLEGEHLQGRFAIRYEPAKDALLLYKHRDKYVREEDPLEMELQRSMNKWVPKFDPDKIDLESKQKKEKPKAAERISKPSKQKKAPLARVEKDQVIAVNEEKMEGEEEVASGNLTSTIRGKEYGFSFYRSIGSDMGDIICLITPSDGDPFVMKSGDKKSWEIISSVSIDIARQEMHFRKSIMRFIKDLEI
jgi:hypothetical protein